jgi:hypothetical protein
MKMVGWKGERRRRNARALGLQHEPRTLQKEKLAESTAHRHDDIVAYPLKAGIF